MKSLNGNGCSCGLRLFINESWVTMVQISVRAVLLYVRDETGVSVLYPIPLFITSRDFISW